MILCALTMPLRPGPRRQCSPQRGCARLPRLSQAQKPQRSLPGAPRTLSGLLVRVLQTWTAGSAVLSASPLLPSRCRPARMGRVRHHARSLQPLLGSADHAADPPAHPSDPRCPP
ncbi:hypothetical protein NDU88_008555 [Pleurodeles waltl]|uniref:Uncharacterized protein n=1 Tax=Pleurodeles waltl TaxID=8319 RepID=A0AAV7NZL3_PLEWA|nr:hypothetical protein NDU88_008555 [Pleurodeles waltl]